MPTSTRQNDFGVPTIDVKPYLSDPDSAAASIVIDQVRAACISTGFFQITGHGISKHLQQSVFKAAADFFTLPLDEKKKLDAKKSIGYRGYDILASQSYEEGVEPDLKEGYYVGSEVPPSSPLYGRFFMGPNIWPPNSLLPASDFQVPCEQYYRAIHDLSQKILKLVGVTLATDSLSNAKDSADGNGMARSSSGMPSVFHDLAASDPIPACPLRLLHYPSAVLSNSSSSRPQYGASAHTDFGAITLLLQDDNPGLEVLEASTSPGEKSIWRPIDPNPDAYVVNLGDIISLVTGGAYKSSVHRVICKRPERERFSVVFFFDGCLDAELRAAEGSFIVKRNVQGENGAVKTVEQHMIERLTMSYGSGGKDARREG